MAVAASRPPGELLASRARCSLRQGTHQLPLEYSSSRVPPAQHLRPGRAQSFQWSCRPPAVWGMWGVHILFQAGPECSSEQGSTNQKPWHLQAVPEHCGMTALGEMPFSMSLPFPGEHRHSPALCPPKSVAGFPLILVADETKCLPYSPPVPANHIYFTLHSTLPGIDGPSR